MEKLVTVGDHPRWLTQGKTVLVMNDLTTRSNQQLSTNHKSQNNLKAFIWYICDKLEFTWMDTCIKLKQALTVEAED